MKGSPRFRGELIPLVGMKSLAYCTVVTLAYGTGSQLQFYLVFLKNDLDQS